MPKVITTEIWLSRFLVIHGTKYRYPGIIEGKDKIDIECYEHGVFTQSPYHHYKNKSGCPVCGRLQANKTHTLTTENFIIKSNMVHHNIYTYKEVEYIRNDIKVLITCTLHGVFSQTPNNHLAGNGCPSCATLAREKVFRKKYYDEPTLLYYVKFLTEPVVYKIGITMQRIGVTERFKKVGVPYKLLQITEFNSGKQAYDEEQNILRQFKQFKYIGEPLLDSGNSELFIKDVLCIEKP